MRRASTAAAIDLRVRVYAESFRVRSIRRLRGVDERAISRAATSHDSLARVSVVVEASPRESIRASFLGSLAEPDNIDRAHVRRERGHASRPLTTTRHLTGNRSDYQLIVFNELRD
jgi:hypothetical protein